MGNAITVNATTLLGGVTTAQSQLTDGVKTTLILRGLLDTIIDATDSEYGCIGEVHKDAEGKYFTSPNSLISIAAQRLEELANKPSGPTLGFQSFESLLGRLIRAPTSLADPLFNSGTDATPPPLLGIPLIHRGELIGLLALAHCRKLETPTDVQAFKALTQTCTNTIVLGRESERRRRLCRSKDVQIRELTMSRDHLLAMFGQMDVGVLIVNADHCISFVNQRPYFAKHVDSELVGARWEQLFSGNTHLLRQMTEAMQSPPADGQKVCARWRTAPDTSCVLEIDVRRDPRDSAGRILHFYDHTQLSQMREREELSSKDPLIGESEPMIVLFQQIADIARGDWNVLIVGETGVGKELVARAVHVASPRRAGPYVAVNCAGLTDSLLESQLFGHRRGAFTGAIRDQQGLFESARGGTLFLDEIGDVSPKIQISLLRAIQEKEILRIGDTKPRKVDVRIISASHRELDEHGGFRADLLYRIRTGRILVPPLRERPSDIPLLAQSFLASGKASSGHSSASFTQEALQVLCSYLWPGNVRELKSAVDYCLIHFRGERIKVSDLPPELHSTKPQPGAMRDANEILDALDRTHGNRTQAAQLLGIGRATLYRRMRSLNIDV